MSGPHIHAPFVLVLRLSTLFPITFLISLPYKPGKNPGAHIDDTPTGHAEVHPISETCTLWIRIAHLALPRFNLSQPRLNKGM